MNRVAVEPALLYWARKRAGRSVEDLQKRFPKLDAWERGAVQPTLKQLEAFAQATHTPVGYLFLPEPPEEQLPVSDFRTMGGAEVNRPSLGLLDTLYLCQQRQEWYREEARITGEAPLDYVGSLDTSMDAASAGARLRAALGFDVQQRRHAPTWTEALRQFIEQAEALGVLVMVSGVVGNNTHRRLDPEEFRGFALSDPWAPLVFINGADTKAAQMFTLAHELAHLWLGQSGVSNVQVSSTTPGHSVERWCNQVAAELLVPSDLIRAEFDAGADLPEEVNRLARHFKVSTLVILRRIHDTGGLRREAFQAAYSAELARLRGIPSRGGRYPRNVMSRAGRRFARALVVSTLEGRTSFTESYRLLDIKKLSVFKEVAQSLDVAF